MAEISDMTVQQRITTYLSVQMRHRIGALRVDVDFCLNQPWTILFGPSGSGKTTILRTIGGLIKPDHAHLLFRPQPSNANHVYPFVDTEKGVFIPSHRRPVRCSAQTAALFPHLTVRQNIRYGIDDDRPDGDDAADRAISRFHLEGVANKWPAEISGGERQRVSVARAAAAASTSYRSLLLLDEPFTGLDLPLRNELIADLCDWLTSTQTYVLSVTHDVGEAFQLGAEVIKLAEGQVVAQGPVEMVLKEERARILTQLNAAAQSPA